MNPLIYVKISVCTAPGPSCQCPLYPQKRTDLSRQLIRVWVQKYETGALDEDAQAADLLQEYEARIVAVERLVGRQALEIEFLKGALKNGPRPRRARKGSLRQRTPARPAA